MSSPGRNPPPQATAVTPQGTGGAVRLSQSPLAQRLTSPTAAIREAARTLRTLEPLQREAQAEQASLVPAARDSGGAAQHDAEGREGSARKAQRPGSGPGKWVQTGARCLQFDACAFCVILNPKSDAWAWFASCITTCAQRLAVVSPAKDVSLLDGAVW